MKRMKRCLALLLCLAALLSILPAAVYASDDTDEADSLPEGILALEYLINDSSESIIWIITFAPKFSQPGAVSDVTLTYTESDGGTEKVLTFTDEDLLAEWVTCGEEIYPQLFIRMSDDLGDSYDIWETGVFEIAEGTFCGADGSTSSAYSIPLWYFERIYYWVIAYTDQLIDDNQVLAGTSLAPEAATNACLADTWINSSRFFLDEQALESDSVAPKKGMHSFRVQLNDFVYDDVAFEAVSRIKGKAINMKYGAYGTAYYLFKILYRLPFIILFPVFGPLAALQYGEYAWLYTKYFFANLFGIDTYEGYIV